MTVREPKNSVPQPKTRYEYLKPSSYPKLSSNTQNSVQVPQTWFHKLYISSPPLHCNFMSSTELISAVSTLLEARSLGSTNTTRIQAHHYCTCINFNKESHHCNCREVSVSFLNHRRRSKSSFVRRTS